MIRVEGVAKAWAEHYLRQELPDTVECWRVECDGETLLVAGIIQSSLVGLKELWVVPARALFRHKMALRALRAEVRGRVPPGLVAQCLERNARFAEFFGFRAVGAREVEGRRWLMMEAQSGT